MRLNARGEYCAPGSGLGVVSMNGVPIDSSGSDACWLTDDVLLAQHCDQACQIRRFDLKSGEIKTEDPQGANWLRAGGGVWRAWLNGHIRGSDGFSYDGYLCDVSPEGVTVTAPPSFDALTVSMPDVGGWNIATGPVGNNATSGPNVRYRDGLLCWQGVDGWHLRNLNAVSTDVVAITPRAEVIYFTVQTKIGSAIWLIEQSGRLTARPHNSTIGYIITDQPVYGIDARYVNGKIRVVWASSLGEPPEHQHVYDQDLTLPRVELNETTPPPDPIPIPGDPMQAYGSVLKDFTPGKEEKHPDGGEWLAVRNADGTFLCVTPDGNVETRTAAGPWERFKKSGNTLVAERDKGDHKVIYVLPIV